MNCKDERASLLPFYASGALGEAENRAMAQHLSACGTCRAELALWQQLGQAVMVEDDALPAPPPSVLTAALKATRDERPGVLVRAWQLLQAQVPLVRREIWLATALVLGLGVALAFLAPPEAPAGNVLEVIAPLVAAAGVAMIFDRNGEPALEVCLATPTSPRQILLARLALIFSYDLLLTLGASAVLLATLPAGLPATLILDWLGPMAFLSALALVLSLVIGAAGANTVVLTLWFVRWLAGSGATVVVGTGFGGGVERAASIYLSGWNNPGLLFGLAALLALSAFWLAGRPGVLLPRGRQSV